MADVPPAATNSADLVMTDLPDAAALVTIQPEATVSRTVMRAEGVRAVVFAFDEGERLSEHTAAVPAIVQVLEGRLRIGADGRYVDLAPGGLVHFSTRLPHEVIALEPSKMVLFLLDCRQGKTKAAQSA